MQYNKFDYILYIIRITSNNMMYKQRQLAEHGVDTSDGALWQLVAEIVKELAHLLNKCFNR